MRKLYLIVLFLTVYLQGNAQLRNTHFSVEGQGIFSTAGKVPFWLRSNQFGSNPLPGPSASIIGSIRKDYHKGNDSTKTRLLDWGGSFEGRVNVGDSAEFFLIEGYGKIRVGIFELKGGRIKEMMGLTDTTLSSGAFSVAGNALGIPKVEIAVPEFYILPIFGEVFAFKGNFAHGWIGYVPIQLDYRVEDQVYTYFHQKSLYGRFGKPDWKLKLYGGFNHQAYWGNENKVSQYNAISAWQAYLNVLVGKVYNGSKVGNHLGSIDLGLEYDFDNIRLLAYRQSFYDVGALYYLANILDGLNGLSLLNKQYRLDYPSGRQGIQWRKLVFEILYTKNQAGESWSRVTPSGDENYYNNYIYAEGWSYKGLGVGTPFISTRISTKEGLPSHPWYYFINNRVLAFHLGFEGSINRWNYIGKMSYSKNYGTYGTSLLGESIGGRRLPPKYGIFPEADQFSAYFEGIRELRNGFKFGYVAAFDLGGLYDDSFGIVLKLSKSF